MEEIQVAFNSTKPTSSFHGQRLVSRDHWLFFGHVMNVECYHSLIFSGIFTECKTEPSRSCVTDSMIKENLFLSSRRLDYLTLISCVILSYSKPLVLKSIILLKLFRQTFEMLFFLQGNRKKISSIFLIFSHLSVKVFPSFSAVLSCDPAQLMLL